MDGLISLHLNEIKFNSELVPRLYGRDRGTADVEQIISEIGITSPLGVIYIAGEYHLVDSIPVYRALVKMKWNEPIPCLLKLKNVHEGNLISYMILAAKGEKIPDVVLNKDGDIIGGLTWACHQLTDARDEQDREPNYTVATKLGVTPDIVGAYRSLWYEDDAIVRRVADGDMAITVYSRLKTTPLDVRLKLVESKSGQISRRVVDAYLRSGDLPIRGGGENGRVVVNAESLFTILLDKQQSDGFSTYSTIKQMLKDIKGINPIDCDNDGFIELNLLLELQQEINSLIERW